MSEKPKNYESTVVRKIAAGLVSQPAMTDAQLDALVEKADAIISSGTARWQAGAPHDDGAVLVYSPSRGLMRMLVPIAQTTEEYAPFIAAANPDTLRALVLALREAREERDKWQSGYANAVKICGAEEQQRREAEAEVARLRAENERMTKALRPMCQSQHPVDRWCCERPDGHREAHGAFLSKSAGWPIVYWEELLSAALKATGGQKEPNG